MVFLHSLDHQADRWPSEHTHGNARVCAHTHASARTHTPAPLSSHISSSAAVKAKGIFADWAKLFWGFVLCSAALEPHGNWLASLQCVTFFGEGPVPDNIVRTWSDRIKNLHRHFSQKPLESFICHKEGQRKDEGSSILLHALLKTTIILAF